MVAHRFDPRRYSPWVLVAVGTVTLAFLLLSFAVEIRVVIETPRFGDVSRLLQTLWRVFLGVATTGSFLPALYNLKSDEHTSGGTARGFEIKGRNHDIDFHLHVPDRSDRGGLKGERTATELTDLLKLTKQRNILNLATTEMTRRPSPPVPAGPTRERQQSTWPPTS